MRVQRCYAVKQPSKKAVSVAALALAAILGALIWNVTVPKEPEFDGKRLSTWLDELSQLDFATRTDPDLPQVKAIREIGTNAIPWLLKCFQNDGSLRLSRLNWMLDKQSFIAYRFPTPDARLAIGTMGFWALGDLGEPAIPELMALVNQHPGYVPGALAGVGRPAIPALQICLANTTPYTTSIGSYAIIPGNTITDIFNATSFGPFSKDDIAVFLPAIEAWAIQTTNLQAQTKAKRFLEQYDQLE